MMEEASTWSRCEHQSVPKTIRHPKHQQVTAQPIVIKDQKVLTEESAIALIRDGIQPN